MDSDQQQRPDFRVLVGDDGRISVYHELGRTALVDVHAAGQQRRQAIPTNVVTQLLLPETDKAS